MGKFDKQLKYSIRKVSIGAASVVIGAFYLAMGAGVVHAETNTPTDGGASHSRPSPESETSQPNGLTSSSYGAEPAQNPGGLQAGAVHSVKEEMKTITRTIKYVNASDESKEVSATVTQTVTLTRKQGTEEWTTGKWEAQTSPTVNGFGAPDKSTIESKEVTSTTENEDVIVYYTKLDASSTLSTRGRRSKRDVENPPAGGTSNTSTGTETAAGASTENNETLNSALTERKGATVKPDQPGVNVPKGNEHGAHDPSAHLSFNDPDHTATVEEMWKIIQHMPDDFQNNERSYLRNMDTLGRELRFDKTPENPEGVPLQPGEIRELHDFGGWHAIDENGNKGKFAIGRKNAQGYFTGWHKVGQTENGIPIIEQGGMLGADALDNIYVHEQALDRRFDYMLMLVKGRTRANRNETVADNSTYDPRTPNERSNLSSTDFNKLHLLEKDKFNKYSPGVVGYNGIEKKFTAFSTKYGSRVRVDFVTGYITDINGSKGSYRVVIKAQNSKGEETKVYDETISRVAEIVQNEELYKKGLNVESAHANILKFLKGEFEYRVNKIKNPKVKANSLLGRTKEKDYTSEQQKVYDQIVEEATEEAKKQGDIVMNVTEDFLSIAKSGKKDSEWKKTFTNASKTTTALSNDLNTLLKNVITPGEPNSPTWAKSTEDANKADDKAYKLLTALIPGAKKITYHVNDDQLEVETDKYTYTAARNGSKEVGIQGSDIAATLSADTYGANPQTFDRENTNTKANNLNHGWATSSSEEFKHFSRFLGVDKGIVRTNVISDEGLSAKIKEAVGPGYSKLGKAGYFSTADIPLGPDIVSYTVQVIPSDNERVGVNPQSSRIQYNMPILADFSVIQDTVEPSKELAKRILTKLKEQGKITEDQEKKIKEEIDKSKKTSEVRSAMSGDVTVRYVDTNGNNLPITDADAKKAGEKTDNGYLVRKDVLIGTDYDVHSKKVLSFNATNGKYYALRSVGGGLETSSDTLNGSITKKNTVITFVYEERTVPPTGKGVVHFKKKVSETVTEPLTGYGDITLEGNVGETFSSTDVDTRITALKNAGYEIVEDTFTNGDKIIDSTADVDGQDPSQVYNVIVREKVETVTTPPTPDTPVDPSVPEGPKWPETGLKESDLKKEVTRTITYVKKETADGEKIPNAQPTKVDKVLYKRTATYNLVSKTVTYSDWTATADDTHTATSFSPVKTPVLTGYVANIKEVTDAPAAPNENGEVTNMTREVVYTKLGSWVPKIPGKTPIPIPYPNDPKDPTKPKYPDYPTTPENPDGTPTPQPENPDGGTPGTPGTPEKPKTPELPVIPYEPGYTPGIPTDPTQPVDPKDNPLVPLKPVDPKDPKKGYKVPEIPETPGKDTPITYVADPQKAIVKYVVEGTNTVLHTEELTGDSGTTINYTTANKLAELKVLGYELVTDGFTTETGRNFDKDKTVDQTFEVTVKPKVVDVPPFEPTNPKGDDNPKPEPGKPIDPENPNGPKWTKELIDKLATTKHVTRTITYVEDGTDKEVANKATDKVTFTRSLKVNVVTGDVVDPNVAWTSNDTTFDEVTSPVVKGYILKANQGSEDGLVSTDGSRVVASTNLTEASENQNLKVVYTKLGSWVPKVPGVETPTPLPYPNHPTDPTKPGEPEYPQPGTPVEPNTPKPPVIPYVPGYTPKTPNGNPLVPVDPEHPENGYKVPPVPTTPGNDTPITYEKDPQKAIVKYVVEGTTKVLHTEELTGDSGTTINYTTANKLAELKVLGYELVTDGFTTETGRNFDKDKTVDQTFEVTVKPKVVDVPPFEPTNPKGDDNPKPEPGKPIDPENPNGPKWTKELIDKLATTKHVTRTITYVEDGTDKEVANKATDKVTFTRSLKVNVVTGDVVDPNVAWTSNDTTFDEVTSPVVKGYILKANQGSEDGLVSTDGSRVVASTNLTEASENQNLKVVYTKLGSWVPKVPGVETPTPLPYPNHPTDPTKPGDPTDPNTPNVPVIPYVPGYTPKIGETPLQPKVPNDPTQGYIPPVPTEPGKDTPIEYVKVPNTPSPEEPVKPTPESNHITIWVDENGKPLKPEKPGTHEPGNIPGYQFITTTTKDGVTIHKFEKITPVEPNNPVPQKPTTPIPTPQDPTIPTPESQIPTPNTPEANTPTSETSRREELPNTGTEANANFAALGLLGALSGFGLLARKKKED